MVCEDEVGEVEAVGALGVGGMRLNVSVDVHCSVAFAGDLFTAHSPLFLGAEVGAED